MIEKGRITSNTPIRRGQSFDPLKYNFTAEDVIPGFWKQAPSSPQVRLHPDDISLIKTYLKGDISQFRLHPEDITKLAWEIACKMIGLSFLVSMAIGFFLLLIAIVGSR